MSGDVDIATPGGIAEPAGALGTWALFLAGPMIWITHFMAVYLLAEAVCAAETFDATVLGVDALTFATVSSTAVAAAGTLAAAWLAKRRRDRTQPELVKGGVLLSAFSCIAVLFVGVPAIFLPPC